MIPSLSNVISGVVGVLVPIIAALLHKWYKNSKLAQTVAQDVSQVASPVVNVLHDFTNGAQAAVDIHDLKSVLDATTKQGQKTAIESLLLQFATAAETSLSNLTPTQIGGAVAYVMKTIPASWHSVVSPSLVTQVLQDVSNQVKVIQADPGFTAVQSASAYTHTAS